MKVCTKCKIEKDESEFKKDKRKKSGVGPECKLCTTIRERDYRRRNPEKTKLHWQKENAKRSVKKAAKRLVVLTDKINSPCKICPSCKVDKPKEDFNKHKSSIDGLRYQCKACEKLALDKYVAADTERIKEKYKRANTKKHALLKDGVIMGKLKAMGFTDNDIDPTIIETHRKILFEKRNRVIINIETGIFYDSLVEAARSIGRKPFFLHERFNGRTPNNTPFRYV